MCDVSDTVLTPVPSDYSDKTDYCLDYAIFQGASDLHMKSMCVPSIRKYGDIEPIPDVGQLFEEDILRFTSKFADLRIDEISSSEKAIDFSFSYKDMRFRGNFYRDMRGRCVSIRLLQLVSTDFHALRIPDILKTFATRRSGLILITGPTGSGKTTTLTCLVEHINNTQKKHIITIEDPIEFVYQSKSCIISQREIGRDADSFGSATIEAMREDPDIILVGEMRDLDSIEAAVVAAETGHLVLATLHTKGTANSVDRIIDVFPPSQQSQIRTQLSTSLIGIISQQLVPGVEVGKRLLATEVLVCTPAMRNMIRSNKTFQMSSMLQISQSDGMYSMKSSLESLLEAKLISRESYDQFQIV